jgi:hypothetical protein
MLSASSSLRPNCLLPIENLLIGINDSIVHHKTSGGNFFNVIKIETGLHGYLTGLAMEEDVLENLPDVESLAARH